MKNQARRFATLCKKAASIAALLLTFAQPALCDLILPVTYRGYVDSAGAGNIGSGQQNFLADPDPDDTYHNWFGFNLASQAPITITSAKLYLFNTSAGLSGYNGVAGSGTYTIYNVSPSSQTVLNSGTTSPGVTVFTDLGSGTSYGSTSYSTADIGNYMVINLNASALSDLQAAWGSGYFNIGGAATGTGYVFGFSAFVLQNQTYLEIASSPEAVPEPGTWAAAALLVGGAGFMRWRKRAKVS